MMGEVPAQFYLSKYFCNIQLARFYRTAHSGLPA